jgi:RNA polymerase sigma factor (sigma-70 family)
VRPGRVAGFDPKESHVPSEARTDPTALARSAAAGDRIAWEALVERVTPTLRSVARGFRLAPADVDDVVQATWLAAFTHIGKLRRPEAVRAWLIVTARREALRSLQRSAQEVLTDDVPDHAVTDDEALEAALAAEQVHAVRVALRRLPDRQRQIIEGLFSPDQAGYAELSARLGIPIGAIGPTRERALARLGRDPELTALRRACGGRTAPP